MREIGILFAVLAALLPRLAAAAPVASPEVTMTATLEQPECPEGQAAELEVALHNGGAKGRFIGFSAYELSEFHFVVMDAAGHRVPPTIAGERIATRPMGALSNMAVVIDPGKTIRYRFNLTRMFDLSRAGTYVVGLERNIFPARMPAPANEAEHLTAGPITLRMVENDEAMSGPTAFTPPRARSSFLYLGSQGTPGTILRFRVEEDGKLSDHPDFTPTAYSSPTSFTMPTQKEIGSLAATPDGRFLYQCNGGDNTISQFRIGKDGALSPLLPAKVLTQRYSAFLVMDPHGHFLWALSTFGDTHYSIGSDGALTLKEPVPLSAWDHEHTVTPATVGTINAAGNLLIMCVGDLQSYRVAPDGHLTELEVVERPQGLTGPGYRALAFTPSGRFAFALLSRSEEPKDDCVVPIRVGQDGTLTVLPGIQSPIEMQAALPKPFGSPNSTLAVDPSGRFLLVVNDRYICRYRIGRDGTLIPLGLTFPPDDSSPGRLISVACGPENHMVYVIAYGPYGHALSTYRLDDQGEMTREPPDSDWGIPLFAGDLVSSVPIAPPGPGPVTNGIAFAAHFPRDEFLVTQPAILTVVLKNVTSQPIRLPGAMPSFHLAIMGPPRARVNVLRDGGEPATTAIPLLAAGHELLDSAVQPTTTILLQPGEQRQYCFVLSRLADLSLAGHYTVQVHCHLPNGTIADSSVVRFWLKNPSDNSFSKRGDDGSVP